MKIIIAGGRNFDNQGLVDYLMDKINSEYEISMIISGGQRTWDSKKRRWIGADFQGEEWARKREIPYYVNPAKWNTYNNAAGPIRNEQNAKIAEAVVLLEGGKGTNSMRKMAEKYGLIVLHDAEAP